MPKRTPRSNDRATELSRSLLRLRTRAGLSQMAASAKVGITQSLLSRAENGRALLTDDVLVQVGELYGASAAERAELLEMASALAAGRVDSRLHMQRGNLTRLHDRFYAIERDARLVRSYQPGAVLGVLQTAGYIEAVFTTGGHRPPDELAELVENRLRRNTMMFTDPAREWRLIQTVGALDWNIGGPAVMAAQIDRMIEATLLPNVRLGVIPPKRPVRFFAQHGFHIYDESAVLVGTVSATALTENRTDLAEYTQLFDLLEGAAVYDDEVRDLLTDLAGQYRQLAADGHSGPSGAG